MTARRVFGIETEYALTALNGAGEVVPADRAGALLLQAIARTVPCLRGSYELGVFLGNGSRFYVDCGAHPELAGPECQNPSDIVRFARAGDLLIQRATAELQRQHPSIAEMRVFGSNVDYSGSGATWGAHESYGHRADPAVLRTRLVSHLVSRIVYAGAGGFNPLSHGLEFTLSPRAHHLRHVVSDESTHDRGIVHARNESLCDGYRRQHLICGESLHSDLATWLKVGVTAIVVALIEAGLGADDVELASPLDALMVVARDPTCRAGVATTNGRSTTAIEIQRRYLRQARAHLDAPWLPPWAGAVCDQWSAALDRLERGPGHVSATFDWSIKLAIYQDRSRKRGIEWNALPVWSQVVDRLEGARREQKGQRPPLSAAYLAGAAGAVRDAAEASTPHLRERGLEWNQLDAFLALRAELLETDLRWGQLGPNGIFADLDVRGVLDHRVPGIERIEEAMEEPPAEGRAHVRGTVIRRFAAAGAARASCGWDHVLDHDAHCALDLSDPFVETEHWDFRQTEPEARSTSAPRDSPRWRELTRMFGRSWLAQRRRAATRDTP